MTNEEKILKQYNDGDCVKEIPNTPMLEAMCAVIAYARVLVEEGGHYAWDLLPLKHSLKQFDSLEIK